MIMNLIATLRIIYASLHNGRLSEYQLSLPPLRTRGEDEEGEVGSSESDAAAAPSVSV